MKGQEFAVIKILLGAVIAIVFLSIVYFIAASQPKAPKYAQVEINEMIRDANETGLCISRIISFTKGEVLVFHNVEVRICSDYRDFFNQKNEYVKVLGTADVPVSVLKKGSKITVYLGSQDCKC